MEGKEGCFLDRLAVCLICLGTDEGTYYGSGDEA